MSWEIASKATVLWPCWTNTVGTYKCLTSSLFVISSFTSVGSAFLNSINSGVPSLSVLWWSRWWISCRQITVLSRRESEESSIRACKTLPFHLLLLKTRRVSSSYWSLFSGNSPRYIWGIWGIGICLDMWRINWMLFSPCTRHCVSLMAATVRSWRERMQLFMCIFFEWAMGSRCPSFSFFLVAFILTCWGIL